MIFFRKKLVEVPLNYVLLRYGNYQPHLNQLIFRNGQPKVLLQVV